LTEPRARALVDRTVGELARLQAGLGHTEELAALLDDIGDRPVSGPATEAVQAARETLGAMRTDPKHLYLCGPQALKALMLERGAMPEQVRFLDRESGEPEGREPSPTGATRRTSQAPVSADLAQTRRARAGTIDRALEKRAFRGDPFGKQTPAFKSKTRFSVWIARG
jgi:hypothetical protein